MRADARAPTPSIRRLPIDRAIPAARWLRSPEKKAGRMRARRRDWRRNGPRLDWQMSAESVGGLLARLRRHTVAEDARTRSRPKPRPASPGVPHRRSATPMRRLNIQSRAAAPGRRKSGLRRKVFPPALFPYGARFTRPEQHVLYCNVKVGAAAPLGRKVGRRAGGRPATERPGAKTIGRGSSRGRVIRLAALHNARERNE